MNLKCISSSLKPFTVVRASAKDLAIKDTQNLLYRKAIGRVQSFWRTIIATIRGHGFIKKQLPREIVSIINRC